MSRHQTGHIYESHGAFHLRYYAEVDGVRKHLSYRLCTKDREAGCGSPTAKAVVMLGVSFMHALNSGEKALKVFLLERELAELRGTTPPSMKVRAFWARVYFPYIKNNLKYSTWRGYRQVWKQHLNRHFKDLKLNEYKAPMMTKFLTNLTPTMGHYTLANIKNITSGLFVHAVAIGECESNPIKDAQVLGKQLPKGVTKSYSLEEVENVISALVEHVDCQLIMALAFFLGLRKGEIAGLQWGDIDTDFVHVRRAIGRGQVGTPKTRKSLRSVPLIAPVRLFLGLWRDGFFRLGRCRRHREEGCRDCCRGQSWVFPSSQCETNPISLDGLVAGVIRPTLEKTGLPWKGLHAGRRGLGTTLRSLTGNSNAGRDMLGHSNAQVTEAHYEAAMPEAVMVGMKLLEGKVKL